MAEGFKARSSDTDTRISMYGQHLEKILEGGKKGGPFEWAREASAMSHYTVVMPAQSPVPDNQQRCDYPRGLHCAFMLAQIIVGAVSLGLVADMGSYQTQAVLSENEFTVNAFISFGESTALMMVGYGCLLTTSLLLISSLLSPSTFHHVPRSLFFVLYHLVSASLYLSSGLSVVVLGYQRRYEQSFITAGALGIVNAIFYLLSTCLGLRVLKNNK